MPLRPARVQILQPNYVTGPQDWTQNFLAAGVKYHRVNVASTPARHIVLMMEVDEPQLRGTASAALKVV